MANNKSVRINGQIRAHELRVISESGEQLGVMPRQEALRRAEDAGLDLIEVSPNATPPVAKVIDWGKYQYQLTKERQRNKKSARTSEVKQIRMGIRIAKGDLDIKLKKVRGFLDDGDKVKVQLVFKGREMAHQDVGFALMSQILEMLADEVIVEQKPTVAGRNLSATVRSNKNAKAKNA